MAPPRCAHERPCVTSLGFRRAAPKEVAGSLHLVIGRSGNRSVPLLKQGEGLLRVMNALYLDDSGQVTYIVINPGGAYFGEHYRYDIEVTEGANLLLASQGATRIYRTPVRPAVQRAVFLLAADSRLEYVPNQTIAYRDADYRQKVTYQVDPSARLFTSEVVTPGWDPDLANFTYTGMHLRAEVVRSDSQQAVCTDNVQLRPERVGGGISGVGYTEGASHMGSVLVVGPHATAEYLDRVRDILDDHPKLRAGATRGERHGVCWVMVRALGDSTGSLDHLFGDVNTFDRSVTTGQGPLNLRHY